MNKTMGIVVFPARSLVRALCAGLYRLAVALALISLAAVGGQARRALAHAVVPPSGEVSALVGFDQRLGEQAPLDLPLRDEADRPVRLGDYFTNQPVILALTYFECTNLCPLVREGLAAALAEVSLRAGQDYLVVVVSIDPAETGAMAEAAKAETLTLLGLTEQEGGWHFLRGEHEAIDRLADAIGFRYAYDSEQDEYAHASGVVVLTADGQIARYFYGIEYAPRDLRLALVEASENRIGSPIDQLLLLCFHYDPVTGRYTPLIMNIVRLAGLATVAALAGLVLLLLRSERRRTTEVL